VHNFERVTFKVTRQSNETVHFVPGFHEYFSQI
jgi:galactose mutarotase-like enzyme